ncbi:response regulator [Caenimonas sedimenti]|uniref:response regulator n=1 Tax=Caenimonas sedimenti TaxID=2596921 RepID=UPI0016449415|nr:response regulator [Caenimonas sedimenti]
MAVDVLLVEDLRNVQAAMVDMLHGLGDYRVVATISTEAEALAWLDQHPGAWGLAVIDLVLDQGSGMSVIMRCRKTAPDARVVVFSNFVSPVIRAHCLKLGADAAFDKNSELSEFAEYCAHLSPHAKRPQPSA